MTINMNGEELANAILALEGFDAAVERGARRLVWEQYQGCVQWDDDPTDTTTSGSEMARRYALSNARAVLEAALRPQSTERARWWRVSFHLWAAGGGLIPTSGCVVARSPEQAIEKAQAASDQRDRKLGRAKCGYFKDATAEPTAEPWRTDR
jgi:hypothetical protein